MDADCIRPWDRDPFYWQYKGRSVLLLGGSVEDNLFQVSDIARQLDLLAECGGNYVRCTMSSRDGGNVWPFERDDASGLYDLERPGAEFWRRFERFLQLTAERDIIVQIEVWATFDFYRQPWLSNPFNPAMNSNYTADEIGLPERVESHPTRCENPFFFSVPAADNNERLLGYQRAFVDEMLARSLGFGHVLYCMDNETKVTPEWGLYWSRYIRQRASERAVDVQTTEMWDAHSLDDPQHANTLDRPDVYSFVDISQNNHQVGQAHWDNLQAYRGRVIDTGLIRPINSVKIYGANAGRFGRDRDGLERFWRNIFGGLASSRFHRPPSGLGISSKAAAHIRSARMLQDRCDIFACQPAMELLGMRSVNEAYCMADAPRTWAVFFTDGGDVQLDVSAAGGRPLELAWLDVSSCRWQVPAETTADGDGKCRLATPRDEGYWVALLK